MGDEAPFEHLVDVGQVHLKAVLVLVDGLRHLVEGFGRVQLGDCVFVELEVAERCLVDVAFGEGAAAEVEVVGWAEEEDAFTACRVSTVDREGLVEEDAYAFDKSSALYAHAAAGPEYEYPACLRESMSSGPTPQLLAVAPTVQ